ncbi:hypothetical protein BJ684DRAFT_22183 [Piptocephalis cylindrospora]|uniref:Secreted protein n=1 Tax=Piptocephalis cylindrospora TaxID=1907219 RepID=A0A4P9XY25_9FUNG|nr:hypothetical protein BJ684DRAFT_22183 [Piptocephalis cylindrospora]|eukprot:RKP11267.1 hypothetical protein BJ684DRAFT_22183 [Piptocephalis cylindrospora]
MQLTLFTVLASTLLTQLPSAQAWGSGGYGWGGSGGWVSGESPPCTAGNVISFNTYQSKYVDTCAGCASSSLAEVKTLGSFKSTSDSDLAAQWEVVSGGSSFLGKVAFKNKKTGKFLGRCTSAACRNLAIDPKILPIIATEGSVSANNVWQCGIIFVDPSIDSSGTSWGFLGGDGQYLAHPATNVLPVKSGSDLQLGLKNVTGSGSFTAHSSVAFAPRVIFDANVEG